MQMFSALLAAFLVNGALVSAVPTRRQQLQFITGPCQTDADCGSGCCGFRSGKCAGAVVALERDGGCGFGDAQSNNNAAVALGFTGAFTPVQADGSDAPVDDAAGNGGSGKPPGTQFITGPCASDADCGSGCCGFRSGKCAGAVVALERDGGCGFGNAQSNNNAAVALGFTGSFTPVQAKREVKRQNLQFITGPCQSDADCGSGCCGFRSGKCAGAVVALERDGGCGFGNAQSNNNAAVALGFTGAFTPVQADGSDAPADDAAGNGGNGGSGKPPGTQFITGACGTDSDCASGCCGFRSGKCAGAVIALERDGGCGFGNAQSNNNAALALGFTGSFTPVSA